MSEEYHQRSTDKWLGWITKFWNWFDDRDIDKHLVAIFIMYGQWKITEWAIHFADVSSRPGLEVAAIIGSVAGTYTVLASVAVTFYFKVRSGP